MLSAWLVLMLHTLFFPLRLSTSTGSFPRALKPDEERACLERAAAGDPTARDELIVHNLRLVAHIVKKCYPERRVGLWASRSQGFAAPSCAGCIRGKMRSKRRLALEFQWTSLL